MTTEELIKKLQEVDPTGKANVEIWYNNHWRTVESVWLMDDETVEVRAERSYQRIWVENNATY